MKELIYPICVQGLDCYTNSILTLINHHFGEYQKALWDSWVFVYDKKISKKISDKIEISSSLCMKNIAKFYNAKVKSVKISKREICEDVINAIKNNGPIMVCLDTYYCNWYENYKETHFSHVFILESYHQNSFIACDTMPLRTNIEILPGDLEKGFVWAKRLSGLMNIKEFTLSSFLTHTINRKEKMQEIQKMKGLVQDFEYSIVIEELDYEYGYDVWSIPLLYNIRKVYGSRLQFGDVLRYVKKDSDKEICEEIGDMYREVVQLWGKIVNVLYKFVYRKKDINLFNRLKMYLEEIVEKEEDVYTRLKENDIKKSNSNLKSIQVCLKENTFSHFFFDKDFTRLSAIETGVNWSIDKYNFIFPKIENNKNNCMFCEGQKIEIMKKDVIGVQFVGYSTWGNQVDYINFYLSDKVDKREVALSDWCLGASFGETILWKGRFLFHKENSLYNGYIYGLTENFEKSKELLYIELPNNKDIIFFAILLIMEDKNIERI